MLDQLSYEESAEISIEAWRKLNIKPDWSNGYRLWVGMPIPMPITFEGPEPDPKARAKVRLRSYLDQRTKVVRLYGHKSIDTREAYVELTRVFLDDLEKIFTG